MMLAGRRICVQTTHTAMAVAPVVGRRNLNLHEHDSKMLMDRFGVTTQRWRLARSKAEALKASTDLVKETEAPELVVKAQILAGGRGKGHFKETQFKGGVHLCKTPQQAADLADEMLGKHLVTKQTGPDGSLVQKVMIAESVELKRELYFALLMDRAYNGPVMVASTEGGMDIEQVAETKPEAIHKDAINIATGMSEVQATGMAKRLGFNTPEKIKDAATQMRRLYDLFIKLDATQVEINPLSEIASGQVYAVDAKINFDDSAAYRQQEVFALHDGRDDDPREVQAEKIGVNYVGMDGSIGCMVNGAGLAMATMDIIKLHKGDPANFLDVGGGASEEQVKDAFKLITMDPRVKVILVNILGGIVKCDTIANGIINAVRDIGLKMPLVVRLAGTNVDLGNKILKDSGLPIITASDLDDAAKKAVAAMPPN